MNDMETYKAAFSRVHTAAKIDMEDFRTMRPAQRMNKRIAILAAAVILAVACSATAVAANLFGLKDLVLKDESGGAAVSPVTGQNMYPDLSEDGEPIGDMDMISLQGYPGSKEYKAVAEWGAFLAGYDQDGALLSAVGNGPTGLEDKYALYLVYTREMADKLDEITSKYGLKLHSSMEIVSGAEELFEKAGTGDFLGTANTPYGSYIYEDGTFHIDGGAVIGSGLRIEYQFTDCKKGSFTDTMLNIGNADDYEEWSYETASGVTVSLALGPSKALVIADLGGSFMTINVLAGTEESFLDRSGKLTAADLEVFADTFDFSALK